MAAGGMPEGEGWRGWPAALVQAFNASGPSPPMPGGQWPPGIYWRLWDHLARRRVRAEP